MKPFCNETKQVLASLPMHVQARLYMLCVAEADWSHPENQKSYGDNIDCYHFRSDIQNFFRLVIEGGNVEMLFKRLRALTDHVLNPKYGRFHHIASITVNAIKS